MARRKATTPREHIQETSPDPHSEQIIAEMPTASQEANTTLTTDSMFNIADVQKGLPREKAKGVSEGQMQKRSKRRKAA
jgi:hypothetical protein